MLKSVFVVAYLTIAIMVTIQSAAELLAGSDPLANLGILLTSAPISLLIARMTLFKDKARTAERLSLVMALALLGAGITLVAYLLDQAASGHVTTAVIMTFLYFLYDHWYSKLDRSGSMLHIGEPLPGFELKTPDGAALTSDSLKGTPCILMFFRGNWCPLCMAQIKELAARYNELKDKGVRVILVSPQSQRHTRALADKFDVAMEFARDQGNAAAQALGIENRFGTPFGMQAMGFSTHTVLPTVIITSAEGTVEWLHETDNYRVRPEPDTFLHVLEKRGLIPAA